MVKPAHVRVSFIGTFGTNTSPYEQWTFSLNMLPETTTPESLLALATAAEGAAQGVLDQCRVNARLREVKAASIDALGKYDMDPAIVPSTKQGIGSAGSLAPQLALAVTLDTPRRGPTGRGRIFLPMPNAVPDAAGLIPTTSADAAAGAVATLCSTLNAQAGFGAVVVASTKGYATNVTSTRCGRVLDVIRSRRAQTTEQYTADVTVTS